MESKRIMIIDDDRELLEEIADVLNGSGYETATYGDSGEAARAVRDIKPDAILLDLQMPVKDGFTVAIELTRTPETSHIPIIGMTGVYEGRLYANLMMICGFQACLVKPIDPAKLIRQIEDTIREGKGSVDWERQGYVPWHQGDTGDRARR
jgi:CheY-like chemotaxis protein